MSDTNSFLDALQRRNGSRRDEEDVSLGDEASQNGSTEEEDGDDGTGIRWQIDVDHPPSPPLAQGDDDDDEVVAIQPPSDPKGDDDDDFSDEDESEEEPEEPAKAKPAKKGKAVKKSSKAPVKGPKQAVSAASKPMTGGRIKYGTKRT